MAVKKRGIQGQTGTGGTKVIGKK